MGLFTTIGSAFGPWGTAIGAGVDYVVARNDSRRAQRQQQDAQQWANNQAIEQEKKSIMGRVDAAKAAGIHPLVAMGAQGLGGPVVSAPQMDTFGGTPFIDLGRPRDGRSSDVKRYDAARADLAELEVEAARRRLATQPGNGGAPNEVQALTGTGVIVPGSATPYPVSHVKIEGQSLPPSSASVAHQTPGSAPGWDVVQIDSGRDVKTGKNVPLRMVVPGGSVQRENWGEQLGELPFWLLPQIIQQSAEASGISSTEWVRRVLGGYSGAEKAVIPRLRGGSRSVYGPVN